MNNIKYIFSKESKLELTNAWIDGKQIKVKYRFTDLDWVNIPLYGSDGIQDLESINWDIDKFEYKIY
jgi:hypothetical protein